MQVMYMAFGGNLIISTEQILSNWLVTVNASNGEVSGGYQDYLIDISTIAPANSLAGFTSSISTIKVDLADLKYMQVKDVTLPTVN